MKMNFLSRKNSADVDVKMPSRHGKQEAAAIADNKTLLRSERVKVCTIYNAWSVCADARLDSFCIVM